MERQDRKRNLSTPQDEHSRKIFQNTLRGQNAWERHQEYVSRYLNVYGDGGKALKARLQANNRNDWDILKGRHRFLREEDDSTSAAVTAGSSSATAIYEDEVAKRYYNHLFKEYAIADMKHYKSGNVALRWRSEEDVVDGIGQFSEYNTVSHLLTYKLLTINNSLACANNRCEHHRHAQKNLKLTPYEMRFDYKEADGSKGASPVHKSALVKVVLCPRCIRKLRYKSDRGRQERTSRSVSPTRKSLHRVS